jgi:diguanylate cyclase (GGDEF)-like protein/PAS domain S-box-containing protein
MRVLVIDDDAMTRLLIKETLSPHGFEIIEAKNGQAGVALALEKLPDLVLLDIVMPGMDGFACFDALLGCLPGCCVTMPVVMLTGVEDSVSIERSFAMGATDFIHKPIDWPLLAHRLLFVMRSHALGRELQASEERLRLLAKVFKHSSEGIMVCNALNKIVEVNQSFSKITGYLAGDVIGKNPKLLASGRHKTSFYVRMWEALEENGYWQGEIWDRRKNGEAFAVLIGVSIVRDGDGALTHYIAVFTDITERKAAESRIEYLAHHDPLTNLPNRTLLQDRFDQAAAQAARNQSRVAVLFLDLDRFKQINDTLGHDVGDRLLQGIAARLLQCVREADPICRQGGDEFIIVLTDLPDNEAVMQAAKKILQHLHEPFAIDGVQITTSFSIGISLYPNDGMNFLGLLNKADTAMYAAKKQGRNTFRFFSSDMNIASIERMNMENGLRNAFEKHELSLYYQPQYAIKDRRLIGMEALLRWEKPSGEIVLPNKLIPVAEDIGLIVPIGHWVLHEACRQNRLWHDKGAKLIVTVNVSGVQFKQGNLVESVRSALASSGLEPRYLELELTETTLMLDTEMIMKIIAELRSLGVTFAIDDFGTGYSSLSYLKCFAIDNLKIDQSFIKGLSQGRQQDTAIVQAIIQLGQALNIQVLAEGVETEHQFDQLQQLGCDKAQGYYLNYPLPVMEFERRVLAMEKDWRQ